MASLLTPRDIVKTGKLPTDIWLIGTVVRTREMKREGQENNQANKGKGWKSNDQKGKSKGKGGSMKSKKDSAGNVGKEIYLNGGNSPADVMVLQAWGEPACRILEPFFKKGEKIQVGKINIKEHNEKTSSFTSSRHALFGIIDALSAIQSYDGEANWLQYHPITPLSSLKHLPNHTFVCLAGMVLSPGPVEKHEVVGSEGEVAITNFNLRAQDGIVKVEAWRDTSAYAQRLEAGKVYFFEGIKKILNEKSNSEASAVRYQKYTAHDDCDAELAAAILAGTDDTTSGATMISGSSTGRRKDAAAFKVEDANWVSLSVVANIIAGKEMRRLEGAVQVPSVLLKVVGDKITYVSCAECAKAVYEEKTCKCATSDTKIRFKADLRMEDATYQLNTVVFDAMAAFARKFADGEAAKAEPEYYHEQADRVEELSAAMEATPFTILLAFEENSYREQIEISLKAAEETFDVDKQKIRHPLKPILRFSQNFGKTSVCPACAVEDTSLEEGAGVTLIPGGTTQKFRALLTVEDKQATTVRESEQSPAVRCSRKVSCAIGAKAEGATYKLVAVGTIDFATRLHGPRKGETLHAIVSRRKDNELAVLAFASAGDNPESAAAFKEFFVKEAQLNKEYHAQPQKAQTDSIPESEAWTPSKKHKAAIESAKLLTTPEPWAKRNRFE